MSICVLILCIHGTEFKKQTPSDNKRHGTSFLRIGRADFFKLNGLDTAGDTPTHTPTHTQTPHAQQEESGDAEVSYSSSPAPASPS